MNYQQLTEVDSCINKEARINTYCYRKSIRRKEIEGKFKELWLSLKSTLEWFSLAKAMFKDLGVVLSFRKIRSLELEISKTEQKGE